MKVNGAKGRGSLLGVRWLLKETTTLDGPSICTPGGAQTIPHCWPMCQPSAQQSWGPGSSMLKWVKGHHRPGFLHSQKLFRVWGKTRKTDASALKQTTSKMNPAWALGGGGGVQRVALSARNQKAHFLGRWERLALFPGSFWELVGLSTPFLRIECGLQVHTSLSWVPLQKAVGLKSEGLKMGL